MQACKDTRWDETTHVLCWPPPNHRLTACKRTFYIDSGQKRAKTVTNADQNSVAVRLATTIGVASSESLKNRPSRPELRLAQEDGVPEPEPPSDVVFPPDISKWNKAQELGEDENFNADAVYIRDKAACSIDRSNQRTPVTDYPLQTILVMEPIGCRAPQKELLLDTKLLHAEETVRPYVGVFSYIAVTRKVSRKCLSVDLCLRSSMSFFRLTRRACWHVVLPYTE